MDLTNKEKKEIFLELYKTYQVESQDLYYPWVIYNYAKTAKVILELGTGWGHSTLALCMGAEESKGKVFGVEVSKDNLDLCISVLKQYHLDERFTPFNLDDTRILWEVGNIDLLFLDTSHQYWHTLYELEYYHNFIADAGVILCHDVLLNSPDAGVNQAIESFCFRHPKWRYRIFTEVPWGMGELTKSPLPPLQISNIPFREKITNNEVEE